MADGKICHPDDNFVSWKDFFFDIYGVKGDFFVPGAGATFSQGD